MKRISQNRKPRSVSRLDPPSCALPANKVPLLDPEPVPTAITLYSINLCKRPCSSPAKDTAPSRTSYRPSTLIENP
jgi:hypothetical protein